MKLLNRLYSQLKQTDMRASGVMNNRKSLFPSCGFRHSAPQASSHLAPPWNLMLALPTVAAQLTLLTTALPVSSLLMAMLVVIVSPFTFKSKEPLSFLHREKDELLLQQECIF